MGLKGIWKKEARRFGVNDTQSPKLCVATKEKNRLHFVVYKSSYKQVGGCMKDRDPKTPKSDKQMQKTQKSSEFEKTLLTTIKMDARSPIQDFLCRGEHQQLFQNLWQRESRT